MDKALPHIPFLNTGIVTALVGAAIFGIYPTAARAVYADGGSVSLMVVATLFCRMLTLVACTRIMRPDEKLFDQKDTRITTFFAGIMQGIGFLCILVAASFIPGGVVITIVFSYGVLLLFISAYFGDLQLNFVNLGASFTALAGLACVMKFGDIDPAHMTGYLFAGAACLCIMGALYLYGQLSLKVSPMKLGAESFIIAFVVALPVLVWQAPELPQTRYGFGMMAVCCLAVSIGTIAMFYAIRHLGSYRFSMFSKMEPVFATIFGIALIGDDLSPVQYFGIGVVVLSLIALQLFDKQFHKLR